YGQNPQYYSYDSDRDGIQDRYDRYDNRYDRYDDRYDRYDDRYQAYYSTPRYSSARADRDCDGVPNRYDRNDRYNTRDVDCDGIPNRFDRVDDRTYRARMSYVSPSRYVTPYGYRYQTYSVGNYLPRGYYGSTYYVDDRP